MTIIINRNVSRGVAAAGLAIGLSAAPAAHAELATLTLNGIFNGTAAITDTITNGTGTGAPTLTANEPFTLTGVFNTSSPNLIAGLPFPVNDGWVDFAPLSVTLTVGGITYSVATYDGTIPVTGGPGLTVAIFGDNYDILTRSSAVQSFRSGIHPEPHRKTAPASSATGRTCHPGYTIPNLVTTTYPTSDFYGVGFGSGVCTGGPGSGVDCTTTSIPLDGGALSADLGRD